MSDKYSILIIGDAVASTGFAKVIYEIFYPLRDRYHLVQLGTNYFGDPHSWPWEIFPAGIGAYSMGEHRIKDLVSNLKPDLIFMLQDPWALVAYFNELKAFPHIPTVVYASFNAADIDPSIPPLLSSANRFVVYTQFAKKALEKSLQQHPDLIFPKIDVLPHGVDTEVFKPLTQDRLASQKLARETLYPIDNEALQTGFIVLNANRNQPRKRIDLTMEGFAMFAKDKPDNVFLHLHMGLKDIGWDIKALEQRYQLEDRLIYSTELNIPPNVDEETLNTIFNAASVGINTASSEGWGLLSFEQAAAGLAQIVPDHTSGRELWKDHGYLLPYTVSLVNPDSNINEHIIHPKDIASTLEKAWNDKNDLIFKEQLCYKNAIKEEYNWSIISKQWEAIIEDQLSL